MEGIRIHKAMSWQHVFNINFGKPSLQSFEKTCYFFLIGHVNIGFIFYGIGNSQSCIYKTRSKFDWLSNTHLNVLQADWCMLKNNEKATLNINMLHNHTLQNKTLCAVTEVTW